jgi:hypothetical protein
MVAIQLISAKGVESIVRRTQTGEFRPLSDPKTGHALAAASELPDVTRRCSIARAACPGEAHGQKRKDA